jgi:hypothetical protein
MDASEVERVAAALEAIDAQPIAPLKEAAAMLRSLAKDASRYQWLRDMAEAEDNSGAADLLCDDSHIVCLEVYGDDGGVVYEAGFGTDALDAAIDAAIEAAGRKEGGGIRG